MLQSNIEGNEAINFDMGKLELEFDYDTDMDLLESGKRMLNIDLYHAVEWFVTEDPFRLVSNLEI